MSSRPRLSGSVVDEVDEGLLGHRYGLETAARSGYTSVSWFRSLRGARLEAFLTSSHGSVSSSSCRLRGKAVTASGGSLSAAQIAAAAAIVSAVVSLVSALMVARNTARVNRLIADRTREAELVVNALSHLVGGSQERTAGLAALTLLRAETPSERWAGYESSIERLLSTQMIYVLTAGRNRWQAHEVENMRQIAKWFGTKKGVYFGESHWSVKLAAKRYIADWVQRPPGKKLNSDFQWAKKIEEGQPNPEAVDRLIKDLKVWLDIQGSNADIARGMLRASSAAPIAPTSSN